MNPVKIQIKEELKQLAKDLRIQKNLFKSKQREGTDTWEDLRNKYRLKNEYRHRHIARCLLRGTPYESIESKVREGNEADMDLVEKYKQEYSARFQEVSHEEA